MEENEREMEKLDAMRQVGLTEPLTEQTRPKSLGEIVGQERGIRALRAALCGPQSPAYHHLWPTRCRQNGGGKTGAGGSQRTAAFPFFS